MKQFNKKGGNMTKLARQLAQGILLACCAANSNAVLLTESGLNVDGNFLSDSFALPGVDASGFNDTTGLGSIAVEFSGAGTHFANLFLDHGIREADNSIFNEYGDASGAAPAGVTWMVDDPLADIFFDTMDNTLQNFSYLPDAASRFDASMAIGSSFDLVANQIARLVFTVSEVVPAGFHVFQTDDDPLRGDQTIYLSSSLRINDVNAVSEPGLMGLLLLAALVTGGMRARKNACG